MDLINLLALLKAIFGDFLGLIFGNLTFSRTKKTFCFKKFQTRFRFLMYCWVIITVQMFRIMFDLLRSWICIKGLFLQVNPL